MTEKTQEQRNAEADAFVQMVKDNMPDTLRPEHVIHICGALITSYGTAEEAMAWTKALVVTMAGFYADIDGGDCDCPKCTENRRARAH